MAADPIIKIPTRSLPVLAENPIRSMIMVIDRIGVVLAENLIRPMIMVIDSISWHNRAFKTPIPKGKL